MKAARTKTVKHPKQDKLTEAKFTRMVIELAHHCGWKTAHFRPALTAKGWRTAVQGDGVGFPDLVLVHRVRRVGFWVELKVPPNKVTAEQQDWLDVLGACCHKPGRAAVWTPDDWPEIEKILKGGYDDQ